ncbi:hypothetical protein Hypma_001381 [Hypsizygus marmoreus]|uniref:Uncharacterized protein n=1 Tax=Hypsizygus marmoreus TaxID=39966 RepID=A0A369K113_HYPMA|nr:hypothetical protein Hypma_001381 [Hypsizygus marmoreus]
MYYKVTDEKNLFPDYVRNSGYSLPRSILNQLDDAAHALNSPTPGEDPFLPHQADDFLRVDIMRILREQLPTSGGAELAQLYQSLAKEATTEALLASSKPSHSVLTWQKMVISQYNVNEESLTSMARTIYEPLVPVVRQAFQTDGGKRKWAESPVTSQLASENRANGPRTKKAKFGKAPILDSGGHYSNVAFKGKKKKNKWLKGQKVNQNCSSSSPTPSHCPNAVPQSFFPFSFFYTITPTASSSHLDQVAGPSSRPDSSKSSRTKSRRRRHLDSSSFPQTSYPTALGGLSKLYAKVAGPSNATTEAPTHSRPSGWMPKPSQRLSLHILSLLRVQRSSNHSPVLSPIGLILVSPVTPLYSYSLSPTNLPASPTIMENTT